MNYQVELLPQAEKNLEHILAWLTERSPEGAITWYRRWLEALDWLEQSANFSGYAPEDEDHEASIRQYIFKTRHGRRYRTIYTIRETTVFVMHIRGPGQAILSPSEIKLPEEDQ